MSENEARKKLEQLKEEIRVKVKGRNNSVARTVFARQSIQSKACEHKRASAIFARLIVDKTRN